MIYGCIPSEKDVRDYRIGVASAAPLPDSVTLPMPSVKNQGASPTCVAHALSTALEYHYEEEHGKHRVFSTEFIYGYRPADYYQGEGMCLREALKTAQKIGDVFNTDLPGNHKVEAAKEAVEEKLGTLKDLAYPHRISAYYRCDTEREIKSALANCDPVIFAIECRDGDKVENGVWKTDEKAAVNGCHAMLIYGYNITGYLVQNSWSAAWATHGRCVIPYGTKLVEAWGIHDGIMEGDDDIIEPFKTKLGKLIAKILNAIIRIFSRKAKKEGNPNETC